MTEFETMGEALVGRTLKKEKRAGVDHYATGQRDVEIVMEEGETLLCAAVSFVDQMGHAVLMIYSWTEDDGWEAFPFFRKAGQENDFGPSPVPDCFEPSDEVLTALNAAKAEWEDEEDE